MQILLSSSDRMIESMQHLWTIFSQHCIAIWQQRHQNYISTSQLCSTFCSIATLRVSSDPRRQSVTVITHMFLRIMNMATWPLIFTYLDFKQLLEAVMHKNIIPVNQAKMLDAGSTSEKLHFHRFFYRASELRPVADNFTDNLGSLRTRCCCCCC